MCSGGLLETSIRTRKGKEYPQAFWEQDSQVLFVCAQYFYWPQQDRRPVDAQGTRLDVESLCWKFERVTQQVFAAKQKDILDLRSKK